MNIETIKLKYPYSSMEPFIDEETMKVHYNKHYKNYLFKLNEALKLRKNNHDTLEGIVRNISSYSKLIRNNAGGAYNHQLFWEMLSPVKTEIPTKIKNLIDKFFGSIDNFKEKFEERAKKSFGSGWVWLILTPNNRLKLFLTQNQDNPLMNIFKNGGYPLLGLDLWEHAYYLKYKNDKEKYIKSFWNNVNWKYVNEQYMKANKKFKIKLTENQLKELVRLLKEDDYSLNDTVSFDNWIFPTLEQLKLEFKVEHELKGNDFFEDEDDFLEAVADGEIIKINKDEDLKIGYRSRTKTKESLLGLIKGYRSYPEFRNEKTLEAIYDGFKEDKPMTLPIVIEFESGRRRVFSGNTRLDIAFQLGIEPRVLLIKSTT